MTDDRPTTDGGETAAPLDVERAGTAPPDAPAGDGLDRLLSDLLDDPETVETAHLVRAGLAEGSGRRTGERLVGALEDKVTVVGSTLDAGFDPANPELDVLVETDHDPGAIAASLASVGPVEGVSVVDATDAVERQGEDDEAVDAADANDVFNELKEEVGREGYGQVVDELEDVSFPGGPDPDEEVDLEEAAGVELDDGEDGALDLEDGSDGGLDGEDELTTKQLLGEEERDDTEIKAPDEKAIEEAIEDVDLEDPTGDDGGASGDDDSAASGDGPTTADATPAADQPAPTSEASVEDGGQGPPADVDAFVENLIEALESGAIDEDRQVALREALGIESTHSLDVRMEYLQKRVDNLAAYTDAWEAFLSEEGSGRAFMESVREDLEGIEARLDDLEAGSGGDLGAVEDRLASIEDRLATLAERHDEDVARLDTRVDSAESKLGERVDALEDAVDALRGKVRSLLQWREHIDDVLGGE